MYLNFKWKKGKKSGFLPECTANLNFLKCTVIFLNVLWILLNVLWIWTLNGNGKKDRFLTKCTANVNFQRFLKILLLMILDAINRISFGNCRRSKGFQVNYRPGQLWKTWFCQYPLKVQICCTFYVEVFLRTHKFNHSMMIQNYCFYLYSHFCKVWEYAWVFTIFYMGLYRYRLSHQACCLCVVQVCRSMNVCLTENEA